MHMHAHLPPAPTPPPTLPAAGQQPRVLLRELLAAETRAARLPLPGALVGQSSRLQLIVVLDLSHSEEVGAPTCALLAGLADEEGGGK